MHGVSRINSWEVWSSLHAFGEPSRSGDLQNMHTIIPSGLFGRGSHRSDVDQRLWWRTLWRQSRWFVEGFGWYAVQWSNHALLSSEGCGCIRSWLDWHSFQVWRKLVEICARRKARAQGDRQGQRCCPREDVGGRIKWEASTERGVMAPQHDLTHSKL